MKILILSHSAPPYSMGGVGSSHYNLFTTLVKLGYNVNLLTYGDKNATLPTDIHRITRLKKRYYLEKCVGIFFKFLYKLFFRDGAAYQVKDIVLSNLNFFALSRKIKEMAPDVLIVADHGVPSLTANLPKQTFIIQIEHHNPSRFSSALVHQTKMSQKDIQLAKFLHVRNLKKISAIVCPSEYMKAFFHRTYGYFKNIFVIPNILDIDAIESIKNRSFQVQPFFEGKQVIYIPSGGSSVKGERYVLSLIQRIRVDLPNALFFISGDITVMLKEELHISGLAPYVHAPGFLPYEQTLTLASLCSACVSPCLAESYGMAMVEALALGLPVFAFNVGGNLDIIRDDCGKLVPCLDIEALATVSAAYLQGTLSCISSDNAKKRAAELNDYAKRSFIELFRKIEQKELM